MSKVIVIQQCCSSRRDGVQQSGLLSIQQTKLSDQQRHLITASSPAKSKALWLICSLQGIHHEFRGEAGL